MAEIAIAISIIAANTLILLSLFMVVKKQAVELKQIEPRINQKLHEAQLASIVTIQQHIQQNMQDVREQIRMTLAQHTDHLNQNIEKLTQQTGEHLRNISGQVDKRLAEGFEKTTATFTDVVKRLALIDEAQKKITELSTNVVGLQDILNDKRSRGAFGEVQLNNLIRNMLPEKNFALQHQLSNNKRADCILFLPEPTGNVVIDAKFPLENYRILQDENQDSLRRKTAEQQFKQDIRKHVRDIASKYIVPQETADGAMMFIPAEAIFADIHANHPELVEFAHQNRVWLTSPTTMMAILTTARAVLKDAATRQQVHIIQEHLAYLAKDFQRFEKRMENLTRHIDQAHKDVSEVNMSAKKITNRFVKIENGQLSMAHEDA